MAKQNPRKVVAGKFLSASDILQADDFDYLEVAIPQWGGKLRLRSMTAAEVHKFNKAMETPEGRETSIARAIFFSAVDAEGNNLFTEENWEKLQDKSLIPLLAAQDAFMKLNKMKEVSDAVEAAKEAKKA
jgi:hypothetical protein